MYFSSSVTSSEADDGRSQMLEWSSQLTVGVDTFPSSTNKTQSNTEPHGFVVPSRVSNNVACNSGDFVAHQPPSSVSNQSKLPLSAILSRALELVEEKKILEKNKLSTISNKTTTVESSVDSSSSLDLRSPIIDPSLIPRPYHYPMFFEATNRFPRQRESKSSGRGHQKSIFKVPLPVVQLSANTAHRAVRYTAIYELVLVNRAEKLFTAQIVRVNSAPVYPVVRLTCAQSAVATSSVAELSSVETSDYSDDTLTGSSSGTLINAHRR
ncbi:hypothetical protein M3Y94_00544400 [Aphelenchoides besseyi]|nr:hypothetical protein M3Y94_00544400 [Aphelenchoides besseyi]